MKEVNKEFIKKEVARLVEYLQEEGDVTIVIFVDHHIVTTPFEEGEHTTWMREQVFSYIVETTDDKLMVDDSHHTQKLCNGDTGIDTTVADVIIPSPQ